MITAVGYRKDHMTLSGLLFLDGPSRRLHVILKAVIKRGQKDHSTIRILQTMIPGSALFFGPWDQNVGFLCLYYAIPYCTMPYYVLH